MANKITYSSTSTNYDTARISIKATGAFQSGLVIGIKGVDGDIEWYEGAVNYNLQTTNPTVFDLRSYVTQNFPATSNKRKFSFALYTSRSAAQNFADPISNVITKEFTFNTPAPTFNSTPTYKNIYSSIAITDDNQMIVDSDTGGSRYQSVEIEHFFGTAYRGAYINTLKINDKSFNYSESVSNKIIATKELNLKKNKGLTITLIDSRGVSTSRTLADITKLKYIYMKPKINKFEVVHDDMSEITKLSAVGTYCGGYNATTTLTGLYEYTELPSGTAIDGTTPLIFTEQITNNYQNFLAFLNEYETPNYLIDSNNKQYYEKTTFENNIQSLFEAAIIYTDTYTQEYLQADYDSVNERYYCISGGYNGNWHNFWKKVAENAHTEVYNDGGTREFIFDFDDNMIRGNTQEGFSIDKNFYMRMGLYEKIRGYDNNNYTEYTIVSTTLQSVIPAIDINFNKVAFHGLFDENVEADIQLNGGVSINGVPVFEEQILWQDFGPTRGIFLLGNQYANLSKKISETKRGIVMVWSVFNTSTKISEDWGWNVFYIPKSMVSLSTGSGFTHIMATGKFENIGTKYFYVQDNRILGNAGNADTGTKNGITFANNKFALRYVIEV